MQLLEKIINEATIKKILVVTGLYIIIFYVINYSSIGMKGLLEITNGASTLDFVNGYSVEQAYNILSQLGEVGRAFYKNKILPLDYIFPMGNMLLFVSWMSFSLERFKNVKKYFKWLLLIPVIAMVADWIENICITIMLYYYPVTLNGICKISSISTGIKFIAVKLGLSCTVILAVVSLFLYLIGKRR